MSALPKGKRSKDPVPSKCILQVPYPENIPPITVCKECNEKWSVAEEYFATFLSVVLSGSVEPDKQVFPVAKKVLLRKPNIRKRIAQACVVTDEGACLWAPEQSLINDFILKNALAHRYHETHELVAGDPEETRSGPLATLDDASRRSLLGSSFSSGFSEVVSRYFLRQLSRFCDSLDGYDFIDGWVVVQPDRYRYRVEGGNVQSVIAEKLFTEVRWAC